MTTRIEHANLTVPDVDAVIAFLHLIDADFRVLHDSGTKEPMRWAHVGTESGYFALFETQADGQSARAARTYRDFGINHIGLVVDDVDAVAERLTAAGHREGYQAERHPARIRRYFHDPAGTEWELVQYLTADPAARFAYA